MRQVNQLKSAIQIHNESIQFLKRQNAELRDELDETKGKVSCRSLAPYRLILIKQFLQLEQHHEYYNEIKKQNLELETEVSQQTASFISLFKSPVTEQQSPHDNHQHAIDDRGSEAWKCCEWKEPPIDCESAV